MPMDQKDRYIQYLVDKVNELDLYKRASELAVDEFQGIHDSVLEELAELRKSMDAIKADNAEVMSELRSERDKRKRAEARARKLDQQLKYAQKNRYGDKRQNARKDEKRDDDADRQDEKDRYDGTDGTISTKSVGDNTSGASSVKEKKDRDLTNRPDNYEKMAADGDVVFHPTDDSKVPGRIIERKTVKVHGMSCWRYLGEFFQKIFNGCRDFLSLTPRNIGMVCTQISCK